MNIELQRILDTIEAETPRLISLQRKEDAAPDPPDFEAKLEERSRNERIRLIQELYEEPAEDEERFDYGREKIRHVKKLLQPLGNILAEQAGEDLQTLRSAEVTIVEFPFKTTEGRGLEECVARLKKNLYADIESSLISRADAKKAQLIIMASVRELEMTFPILTSKNPGTKLLRYRFIIASKVVIDTCKYKIPQPLSVQLWGWFWLEVKLRFIFTLRRIRKRLGELN